MTLINVKGASGYAIMPQDKISHFRTTAAKAEVLATAEIHRQSVWKRRFEVGIASERWLAWLRDVDASAGLRPSDSAMLE